MPQQIKRKTVSYKAQVRAVDPPPHRHRQYVFSGRTFTVRDKPGVRPTPNP